MDGLTSLDDALDRIPAGARLVAAPGCAAPTTLLAGLERLARTRQGLHLYSGLQLEDQPFLPAVAAGALAYSTWHVTRESRDLVAQGMAQHLPVRLADVPEALRRLDVDVALLRVSPPDRQGMVSLGPSMSYSRAAVDVAGVVIAEVDPASPRTSGPTRLPVDRITALVSSERPMPSYRALRPSDESRRIADRIVSLLPDAPTLQLGIGQVPEAVTEALLERRIGPLRFVGLGTEALVDIAEAGLLDHSPRRVPPVAAVELMGGERLMAFADGNPLVGVFPSTEGHDPRWLSAHFDRIASVNSALEVDLLGQVNAEMVDGAQVSGVGGSADFVDAARASAGGLSVVALPSTARRGTVTRIVSRLPAQSVVTIPRHAYHAVVTEHGVADLRALSVRDRARALVAVADPAHREELQRAWAEGGG